MTERKTAWTPILVGDDAIRALSAIDIIRRRVTAAGTTDPSLGSGWAGIALLEGYLARDGVSSAAARAREALDRALACCDEMAPPLPWLASGVVGVAWVIDHLRDVVEVDPKTLEAIDALVIDLVAQRVWPLEYELMEGLIGIGLYAHHRGLDGAVRHVLGHLRTLAEMTPDGITWTSGRRLPPGAPKRHHNTGIALGVAGAIAFLAETWELGSVDPEIPPLLTGAVRWLRSRDCPDQRPRFATGFNDPTHCALDGWCYGNAAVAMVLLRAGHVARVEDWVAHGHELARVAARADVDEVPTNIGFCHGTVGRAHLLNRLSRTLDDAELVDAARNYYRVTLDRFATAELPGIDLQTGWTGVALGLLAAVSPVEPAWDRALLVS